MVVDGTVHAYTFDGNTIGVRISNGGNAVVDVDGGEVATSAYGAATGVTVSTPDTIAVTIGGNVIAAGYTGAAAPGLSSGGAINTNVAGSVAASLRKRQCRRP